MKFDVMLFSNYEYDPMGNRLCKIVKPRDGNGATNQNFWTFTWYIRDAQGNIMATYNETHFADNDDYYACLTASEMPMYGSSRLGVQKVYDTLSVIQYVNQTFDADSFYTSVYENIPITLPDANHVAYHPLYKQYEFSNHLGNVLATVSARPRLIYDVNENFLYKEADVMSVADYEPGGFPTPGRQFNSESYRFGHNTQEKVNEWNGTTGTHYTALFWEYDSRLIWRQNPDPKGTANVSPYSCFGGNPIFFSDVLGDKIDPTSAAANDKYNNDKKNNPKFAKWIGNMEKDKNFIVKYTIDKKEFETNTGRSLTETAMGSIGFDGTNYWVYAKDNKEQAEIGYTTKLDDEVFVLGASTSIEEFVHLDRVFSGGEKFEKNTSGEWGIPGWGNNKEAEDKYKVLGIANIKKNSLKERDNIKYSVPTHYGIMVIKRMNIKDIENFLNNGIKDYPVFQYDDPMNPIPATGSKYLNINITPRY